MMNNLSYFQKMSSDLILGSIHIIVMSFVRTNVMGRKKLNRTKEEWNELNRTYRMRSYWKHVARERRNARERYHKKMSKMRPNEIIGRV
jgi:uncharacterized membrane protein (DUF106 family)